MNSVAHVHDIYVFATLISDLLSKCLLSFQSIIYGTEQQAVVQNRPGTNPFSKAFYLCPIRYNCLILPDQATYIEKRALKHYSGWKRISEYEYIDVK